MPAWVVRVAAVMATVLVLGVGGYAFREALVEHRYSVAQLPDRDVVVVDAGAGVRVWVSGVTGTTAVTGQSRQLLAASTLVPTEEGMVARCEASLVPLSRCAVWVSVTAATPDTLIRIIRHPGAVVEGPAYGAAVEVVDA